MKPLFFLLLLAFTSQLHAQDLIGHSPKQVRKHMLIYMQQNRYNKFLVEEKDTEIIFRLREDSVQPVNFRYEFDSKGKCFAFSTLAHCRECVESALKTTLANNKFGWTKLNDSTWISSYRHSLQMVLKKNEEEGAVHTLDIRKMLWSRTWYNDQLAGKK
ncbi:hypothetical protein [Pseudobacter ginsenosidimutans]|uniref:Uncharacterized protein n=1 Tax=Pseudobacter ginsenosidimutans TaxID=661488 RepID=A0A4Q7N3S7_9BACT|nr:hypothetical protein [Pseudobacter ginsenosidimutans]QEC44180.1 hypothetical protein FSB84_21795 [Pseudobacter ginsenosidimutans]RZS75631.1 hypothetical protein EV199_1502 [Pseudobacter ginsenosidimutans]